MRCSYRDGGAPPPRWLVRVGDDGQRPVPLDRGATYRYASVSHDRWVWHQSEPVLEHQADLVGAHGCYLSGSRSKLLGQSSGQEAGESAPNN